jgi:hypothetical protein
VEPRDGRVQRRASALGKLCTSLVGLATHASRGCPGLARLRVGTTTKRSQSYGEEERRRMSPRHPCARTRSGYTTCSVVRCRRHGLDPRLAARVPPIVGARPTPSARVPCSYGYAFGAPRPALAARVPLRRHGAYNETRQTCAELP